MKDPAHIYLVPPADPLVKEYDSFWETMKDPGLHTLILKISLSDVKQGNIGGVQEYLITLQHHPDLIEKMLFSFSFSFVDDDTDMEIEEADWKNDPIFFVWIQKLGIMPLACYFIADEKARTYFFIHDLMDREDAEINGESATRDEGVSFSSETGNIIVRRIYESSVALLMYCHNCDFDPKVYIEGIMASFDMPFTYEEVLAGYNQNLDAIREQIKKRGNL
jgi:hypothetical protein